MSELNPSPPPPLPQVLKQLRSEGYDVGMLPLDETMLIKSVLNQTDAKFNSADLNIAYRMKVRAGGNSDGWVEWDMYCCTAGSALGLLA